MPEDEFPRDTPSHDSIRQDLRAIESELAFIGNIKMIAVSTGLSREEVRWRLRVAWSNIGAALFRAMAHARLGESKDLDQP